MITVSKPNRNKHVVSSFYKLLEGHDRSELDRKIWTCVDDKK